MPKNKNASYRYRIIDACLANRQRWALSDLRSFISQKLIDEFDTQAGPSGHAISERQILADIAVMRKPHPEGFGAPIAREDGYIFYEDQDFSIHQSPLARKDLEVLAEAASLLRQFSTLPHYQELSRLVQRLLVRVRSMEGQAPQETIIQFEKNDFLKGAQFLTPLYSCIRLRQPIYLTYQPFQQQEIVRTILHPYLLKEFNNRWYVIGWDQANGEIRNYALDRIESFEKAQAPWVEQPDFSPEAYYSDIVGVTVVKENQLEEIILEATPEQASYIRTKPIHQSQRIVAQEQGRVVFSLHLIPNFELESLILSFGEKVKVLAPKSLREKIENRLAEAVQNYKKN